jgi:hypothetical protein
METGVDGIIIDAVNWYINCNWQINNATMTDVICQFGEKYSQPEGAGGFNDDPLLWITEGHYNSVQDYGLSIWWTDRHVIGQAIRSGDPSGIEGVLQSYRDRVVAAGGVTYIGPRWATDFKQDDGLTLDQKLLEAACIATAGELFHGDEMLLQLDWPEASLLELKRLIRALRDTPALQAAGGRKAISTNDDHRFYAFLRASPSGDQQALVVLNFQPEAQAITVWLERPARLELVVSKEPTPAHAQSGNEARVQLPGYGYAVYRIT